jgi:mannose-6-phosphate isomerase-like protein (cupin superfamily)
LIFCVCRARAYRSAHCRAAVTTAAEEISVNFTRRELLSGVITAGVGTKVLAAEDNSLPSGAFSFEKMPMHVANNSAQIRNAMRGKLDTGEGLEVHETTLPPGGSSTPAPHRHKHSEIWLVREGTLELSVGGKTYVLNAGSVGFARSDEDHAIRNAGNTPATYFLVAVGPGAELQT